MATSSKYFLHAERLLLQLTHQGNMQLVRLLLHSPQNDGAFCGGPWHKFQSSAEMNSACGKVLLRKTLVVEQKQQGKLRLRSFYSSS